MAGRRFHIRADNAAAALGHALLLVLFVARAVWGLYNMKSRPAHGGGVLAKLRQFGSGKPMEFFGQPLIAAGGDGVDWIMG